MEENKQYRITDNSCYSTHNVRVPKEDSERFNMLFGDRERYSLTEILNTNNELDGEKSSEIGEHF